MGTRRAAQTPKKPKAFRPKTTGGVVMASKKPPRAGPTMPERFIWSEPSVAAEGSSSSGTTSGINAVQTGALKAKPTPKASEPTRSVAGESMPRKPRNASAPATSACQTLIIRSKGRRSTASAKNPAGKVKSRKGSAAVLDNNEMRKADSEKWISAQRAAVWSAATAVPLARAATHSRENATLARAEKLDDACSFCIRDKTKAVWALTPYFQRVWVG